MASFVPAGALGVRGIRAIGRAASRVAVVSRRFRRDRLIAVAASLAAFVLLLVEVSLASARHGIPVPLAFALGLLQTAGLPAALRRPRVAAVVSLAAALALQALSAHTAPFWPWWPVLIVTQGLVLAAVAAAVPPVTAVLQWVLAVGASATLAALLRPGDGGAAIDVVVFGAIAAGTMTVAMLAAQWRAIRGELLHERRVAAEESGRRLLMEERTRIARELHDVVAHSLSLITVQSSTARFRHREFSAEAGEEFDRIGAQSRQALDEMRGLLQVLRESDERAPRDPQPGLGDVPALVARTAATGADIGLAIPPAGWDEGVGAVTGLTAFRIVQEAMSNALRHAPGADVRIDLSRRDSRVLVSVTNGPARSAAPASTGEAGHGLIGMAERVASVGGAVRTGRTADGGFAVQAELPSTPGRST